MTSITTTIETMILKSLLIFVNKIITVLAVDYVAVYLDKQINC
jgi:hypothetical protein